MATITIEQIILDQDQRGISALSPFLPSDYCSGAARYVLANDGPVLIATGFYILNGGAVETDGPPGAYAIGRALESIGRPVAYITDDHGVAVMRGLAGSAAEVIAFPTASVDDSAAYAERLLEERKPALLIAIERCAPSADGIYRNMRSVDISAYTGRVDALFTSNQRTVGIGDGGNEIGMGSLANQIAGADLLPDAPAAVACEKLVIASVSNWGAYGLLAAMSRLVGRNLLPSVEEEIAWVRKCVELGAVDGFSGERVERVDGLPLDTYGRPLDALHRLLAAEGLGINP